MVGMGKNYNLKKWANFFLSLSSFVLGNSLKHCSWFILFLEIHLIFSCDSCINFSCMTKVS